MILSWVKAAGIQLKCQEVKIDKAETRSPPLPAEGFSVPGEEQGMLTFGVRCLVLGPGNICSSGQALRPDE